MQHLELLIHSGVFPLTNKAYVPSSNEGQDWVEFGLNQLRINKHSTQYRPSMSTGLYPTAEKLLQ